MSSFEKKNWNLHVQYKRSAYAFGLFSVGDIKLGMVRERWLQSWSTDSGVLLNAPPPCVSAMK